MNRLGDYFLPHLEVSLPRAFEAAVHGVPRGNKESFAKYTKRMERAFAHLGKEGVDVPDGAKGYIMYRQAGLTEAPLTWSEGKYGRSEITNALRRLDKVIREKSKGNHLTQKIFLAEDSAGGACVFLADGDLDEMMDEQDVMAALAAYQDTRLALKDQRLGRGYFPGKGKGKLRKGRTRASGEFTSGS